jgi:hypothetical protein
MRIELFNLPAHWACGMIYGDRTGYCDEEEAAMDQWFAATFPNGAHCVDVSSEEEDRHPGFMRFHDAHRYVLACDCAVFSFDVEAGQ